VRRVSARRPAAAARAAATLAALALVALAGCAVRDRDAAPAPVPALATATATPLLRLAPALLGRALDLQQHLSLSAPGQARELDVLLEVDATHVRLGLLAMGQVAARLDWDGVTLTESRAPWWPPAVSGARVLSDLQLTLWPAAAIRAALPPGWRLDDNGATRTLSEGGAVVTVVTRRSPQVIEIEQRREHFRLKIESRALDDGTSAAAP